MDLLIHAHCFFVCLIYSVLQFYVSLSSYKTTVYNCILHALRLSPTGILCLAVAPLRRLPKTRIALGFVSLQFPFITTRSERQRWKGNGGQQKADFGPGTCVRWSGARCVTLRFASFGHRLKSQLLMASETGKMQSWPYLSPPPPKKNHIKAQPHKRCRSEGHLGARVHRRHKPSW